MQPSAARSDMTTNETSSDRPANQESIEVVLEADNSEVEPGVVWSVILKGHAEMVTVANDLFESFELNVRPWHASRKPYFVRIVPMLTTGRRFNVDRGARA
jgi:hypothetical protein